MNDLVIEPIAAPDARSQHVAQFMRQEDRDELWALSRTLAPEAVRQSVEASTEAYVALNKGEPIAVFGAVVPALGRHGVPWLLGTRGVDDCAKEYFQVCRKFVAHLAKSCDVLQNMALADNRKTLVFLSRVGFDIGKPFKTATGAEAVLFRMETTNV